MHTLSRGEQKSLAYHRVVAEKLRDNPTLVEIARNRLQWYRSKNPPGGAYYDAWERLLAGPLAVLIETMTSPSDEACALRQENPFVDLVSQPERARIYRSVVESIESARP